MKKLFLLCVSCLVAVMAGAALVNITPDGTTDLRHAVRDVAAAGDTVVLADGVYTQGGDYTYFDKNIVVMAAEGANPIVKFTVPAQIMSGARAEFIGIKFDMENLHGQSWYEHLIYASDATAGNVLVFDGCEFYNDTLNNSVIYCNSSNLLDSIIIRDCKFYDIMKSCIFVENTSFKGLHISNSTFYNISTNTTSYWAGVIDIRATTAELRIDHCTFYNVLPMNTDYSAVSKVTLANGIVSNCIFMLPAAQDGVRAMRGVTANNCITYNYLKDSGTGIHSSVTKNNCTHVDPLFADAANGDFTLNESSPAINAGTDGTSLGDSRWWPVITLPETDFAQPYLFAATVAKAAGRVALNGENLVWNNSSDASLNGVATWQIHVTRACLVSVTLNLDAESSSGHCFAVELLDADMNVVGTPAAEAANSWAGGDIALTDTLTFPAEGDYTIRVTNSLAWSTALLNGVTFTFAGLPAQQLTVAEAYNIINALEDNAIAEGNYIVTGYVTKVDYTYTANNGITVWIDDTAEGDQLVQLYKAVPEDEASQAIKVGDKIRATGTQFQKYIKNNAAIYEMVRPAVLLVEAAPTPVIVTVGDGSQESPYTVADVIALNGSVTEESWVMGYVMGAWAQNKSFDNTLKTNIVLADNTSEEDIANMIPVQLPNGTIRTELNVVDNTMIGAQIKVKGLLQTYFSVPGVKSASAYEIIYPVPTALDEPEAPYKAVKRVEKGRLIILHNGRRYNVLGQQE